MAADTKPQQRKKEEGKLRGEGDQIKFIDLRFERWQVVRFRNARRRQRRSINCMFLGKMMIHDNTILILFIFIRIYIEIYIHLHLYYIHFHLMILSLYRLPDSA